MNKSEFILIGESLRTVLSLEQGLSVSGWLDCFALGYNCFLYALVGAYDCKYVPLHFVSGACLSLKMVCYRCWETFSLY